MMIRRRRAAVPGLSLTTIRPRALVAEATAGILQRPGRSILTALGTILGVGAFVCVLGITATANGQISGRFNELTATAVTVEQSDPFDDAGTPRLAFTPDAESRIRQVQGVRSGGIRFDTSNKHRVSGLPPGTALVDAGGEGVPVVAASPGYWEAIHAVIGSGRTYDHFHSGREERVAVVGEGVARQLGVTRLQANPAVFIDGIPFTVVGVVKDVQRDPDVLLSVVVPDTTAVALWGPPDTPARMLVETDLGAAGVVAQQAALALRPDQPEALKSVAPPDPRSLRDGVASDLNALFLLLAGICLVIGTVGIANTTLVAVLERVPEIGLRRSLGARPLHIGTQFLTESTALGGLGGLVGTSFGVLVVVMVALSRDWTAVLEPWTVFAAPFIGALTGLVAGLYPAVRAARIEPVEALRR